MKHPIVTISAICGLMTAGTLDAAEWISAVNAKTAGEAERKAQRAADGTSWFAKEFSLAAAPKSAIVSAAGLGVFELYVNGEKVGGGAHQIALAV